MKKQKFIGDDNNFDSDSDSKNSPIAGSNSDPDSVGVGGIIGFWSLPQVSTLDTQRKKRKREKNVFFSTFSTTERETGEMRINREEKKMPLLISTGNGSMPPTIGGAKCTVISANFFQRWFFPTTIFAKRPYKSKFSPQ